SAAIRVADQANTRRLHRDIITGYNKFLSSLPPQSGTPTIHTTYNNDNSDGDALRSDQIILLKQYESSGMFSAILAVVFNYVDERLSWQPHHYDNISRIYVRWEALWNPPLTPICCESFSRPQFDDTTHAEISFDGTVETNLVWQLTCNCTIEHCYNFFSLLDGSSGRDRVVRLSVGGPSTSNDVWYTSKLTAGEETWTTGDGNEETAYFYLLVLRRSSTYYLVYTILPTLLQSLAEVVGMLGASRPTKEDIPIRIALGIGSLTPIVFILPSMTETIPRRDVP
ncbi:hypothetical protein PMAYCL1PPCAC_29948, partial [Pristionchus mayeri]